MNWLRTKPSNDPPIPPIHFNPPPSVAEEFKEYYYIQNLVTGFNQDCLEIKKWSVALASIVAVVGQSGLANLKPMLVVIILLALAFWVTETVWRMNQWAFIRCIRKIESGSGNVPKISSGWARYYIGTKAQQQIEKDLADKRGESSFSRMFENFRAGRTAMPHAIIIIAALFFLIDPFHFLPAGAPPAKPQQVLGSLNVHLVGSGAQPAPTAPR